MSYLKPILLFAGLALGGLTACEAPGMRTDQNVISLNANLNAAQEVPPNASTGRGDATVTFTKSTKTLAWVVTYGGLTGPATMAHFHGPANVGANAPVILPIANTPGTVTGSALLNDNQAADLMAGKWYLNVHTAAFPGGEIRGQVRPATMR